MTAFRVDIDGRVYEGHYDGRINAVYGAMLKDSIERHREVSALAPYARQNNDHHSPSCTYSLAPHYSSCTCHIMSEWRKAANALSQDEASPTLIGVEKIVGRKVAKKVHRVG